jgi:hypothetical protein
MSGIRSYTGFHGAKTRLSVEYKSEGRGHTSARLRFWHDVCPYDPTKLLECESTKGQFNITKLTKCMIKLNNSFL